MQQNYHNELASETLVIGGNRSGKSLCTFVEDAWAATGTHPISGKYPTEGGNLIIVGQNWKHIGLVVVPYLFKSGAFKIIKDNGKWRAFDPITDSGREDDAKPAPPLIPPRMIKSMSWLLKSAGYLNSCELHNGWTIYCFSSEGDPPQGFQADRVHIDEDLANEQWVPEMQARLADRKGRFCWSAMPHSKNEALIGLNERADKTEDEGGGIIKRFVLRFLDNPHIDADEKSKMLERWSALGEDVLRQRAEGEFVTDSLLVYPSFTPYVHGKDIEELHHYEPPKEWTRYAIVDPGHAVTAVLFVAVPPSGEYFLAYDELYLRQCNAVIFAREFKRKVEGKHFYAFLIDAHGGRLTDIGSGKSPQEQYTEQLRELGVASEVTGNSFIPGTDNIQAGLEATRLAMHIRSDGTTGFRYVRPRCQNLEKELRRYKKKVNYVAGVAIVTDEPQKKGDFHLVDCLRYIAAYDPQWHQRTEAPEEPWWHDWKKKRDKRLGKAKGVVNLAPASSVNSYDFL
tara:strand:+ start:987 stop:2522 length:1536 start_codon:yes stop_codon:yes gene_type:complete